MSKLSKRVEQATTGKVSQHKYATLFRRLFQVEAWTALGAVTTQYQANYSMAAKRRVLAHQVLTLGPWPDQAADQVTWQRHVAWAFRLGAKLDDVVILWCRQGLPSTFGQMYDCYCDLSEATPRPDVTYTLLVNTVKQYSEIDNHIHLFSQLSTSEWSQPKQWRCNGLLAVLMRKNYGPLIWTLIAAGLKLENQVDACYLAAFTASANESLEVLLHAGFLPSEATLAKMRATEALTETQTLLLSTLTS